MQLAFVQHYGAFEIKNITQETKRSQIKRSRFSLSDQAIHSVCQTNFASFSDGFSDFSDQRFFVLGL